MRLAILLIFLLSSLISLVGYKKNQEDSVLTGKWEIRSVYDTEQKNVQLPIKYVLEFTSDSSYRIKLDVNGCQGSLSIEKPKLTFQKITCTKACCDSEASDSIVDILLRSNEYAITNDTLNIIGEGQVKLIRLNEK